ncbi:MAG: hypothetical protein UT45_C0004G0034 [Candidatus Daviesbacteria bacterium GW2011_GWA2_39_33]|nr:MAG: hypothetical protein UT45_C0004G0034 [Candidatus Daviesbacteria bacterium GW2011_GWA2_39_33]
MDNAHKFIGEFTDWAKKQDEILGTLLVGSYARGTARPDSDIDIVIITNNPDIYANNNDWVTSFGKVKEFKDEDYKIVKGKRVFYENGLEVEYGITTPVWVKIDPVDPGTYRVISEGSKILCDKDEILKNLIDDVNYSR